ncbi:hypothetical protein EH31_11375 [Erythrobacter longus]|uniref:DUF4345 domain-containing protein n=1 Tax=Erythrobacter longus TaxID=1044 RepID=A0A074MAH2_ERYLO|nr:DUF4345 family protein [Erythrobacter longus]KEO89750.1 hypothetical protein EH31_11375 [Erythrobacter longus]MDY7097206.1 DUF4345 family protein [Pseudomonadota bacterium]
MSHLHRNLGRVYPSFAGCIFLALGIVTLIQPEIMSYYAIGLDQPSARVAMRAMIGGGEIGIGVVLILGGRINLSSRQLSLTAAAIFICVGLSRVAAVFMEGADLLAVQPLREALIEILLGGIGLWAARGLEHDQL